MTLVKSGFSTSPEFSILIDNVPVFYRYIDRVEHVMEANKHDMLIVHAKGLPPKAVRDYRNAPVTCSVRFAAGYVETFHGYVIDVHAVANTVRGTINDSPIQESQLVCLGTSYSMRGEKHRAWPGYTLSDVVSEMSLTYGFSYDVPKSTALYSPMIQDAESDWQFLIRYAKMMGYEVTMHGTHLHVFDPYTAYSRSISFHRLPSSKHLSELMRMAPGSIIAFKARMGQSHPDGVYKDPSVSVHQDDGQVYDVRLSEVRQMKERGKFSNRLLDSVDNYDQAVRAIDAHRKGLYDFSACVTVVGLPGCRPGGVVNIDSYGSEDVDGNWYVKAVRHDIHTKSFLTEIDVVRNQNSQLVVSPTPAFVTPPPPRLSSSEWIAAQRRTEVYG
jgi:phage protein D